MVGKKVGMLGCDLVAQMVDYLAEMSDKMMVGLMASMKVEMKGGRMVDTKGQTRDLWMVEMMAELSVEMLGPSSEILWGE